mmetsp:Transcript_2880/g.4203  ORF Transcript_2880/g.4203 Transcript_2880/m.4203 type:complete len:163 (+) Transcript_2880:73-561(+)
MSGVPQLSSGSIRAILGGTKVSVPLTFQVMFIKEIKAGGTVRYRIVFSDGTNYTSCMLATQRNHLVESHQIESNTIVNVLEYVTNNVRGHKIIIVLDLKPIQPYHTTIGNPAQIEGQQQQQQQQPSHYFQQQPSGYQQQPPGFQQPSYQQPSYHQQPPGYPQ